MSIKIDYKYTNKAANPPSIDDYVSAYVPSVEEIAVAPDLQHKSVQQMFADGQAEFTNEYLSGLLENNQSADGSSLEQIWASEEEYNKFLNIRYTFVTADISQNIKVYLRVKQQYYFDFFGTADITSTVI